MAERRITVVTIGGTGNLAQGKLVPAICNLAEKGRLDEGLSVLGFARRPLDDASYRDLTWAGIQDIGGLGLSQETWDNFVPPTSLPIWQPDLPGRFPKTQGSTR